MSLFSSVFDDIPDIPKCPHCGHDGDGLQWAFPDDGDGLAPSFLLKQCACLACGAHGPAKYTYERALETFNAGEVEE